MGQEALSWSHSSIQSAWKQCEHSGIVFRVSFGLYSHKHIGQVLSSGFGSLRLSPNTIFGYDWIVVMSRPVVDVGCGVIVGLFWGKVRFLADDFSLLMKTRRIPIEHRSAGRPTPIVTAILAPFGIPARWEEVGYLFG